MNTFHDNSPKNRLLAILKDLLNQPYHYTKKMLIAKYGVSKDTIGSDFNELRDADFILQFDRQYRYAIVPTKSHEHLEEVLFFTENEKKVLLDALSSCPKGKLDLGRIREKLETIYDISKLGSSLFSKTFLTKANLLEQAKKEKWQVRLVQYRSTHSNQVTDRLVEPFWVGIKEDIIQAFDLTSGAIRHFRLSRVERVELLPDPWLHETKHYVMATDAFRIVQDQQVFVHLRLKTGAYNELLERFPLAQAYVRPCARDSGVFDFEAKVNAQFYGITNFILGYHEHILEIVEPESLREHIQKHAARINF